MIVIVAIGLALLFFYWFLVAIKHPKNFPPGPRWTLPIIGNVLDIGTDLRSGLTRLHYKYGDIFGLFLGPNRAVVIADHDLVQEAGGMTTMSGRINFKGVTYLRGGAVSDGEGGETCPGVLATSGLTWSEQRRFSLHTLRDLGFGKSAMEEWILEEVAELCRHFENITCQGQETIKVQNDLTIAVLNALWTIISGERMDYYDPKLVELVSMVMLMFKEIPKPTNILTQQIQGLAALDKKFGLTVIPKVVDNLLQMTQSVMESHKTTFQEDSLRDFTDHYLAEIKKRNSIGSASSFKGSDGERNLRNVLVDFFMAGSETTSNTLHFGLLYMVGHPEIQKKVQEELDAVTGRGRPPHIEDRANTPYTEAVIHEIQRISSIAPTGVPHSCSEDTYLGNGKYFIPKGTLVFFLLEAVLKNPKDFPNPDKFDPTRFLDKDGQFVPHPKVIPFGVGKRRCLGESLARMSLYLFFTGILSRFDLEKADSEQVIDYESLIAITSVPKPQPIRLVPRK